MLCHVVVVAFIVRTRPRPIPLSIFAMRKAIHGLLRVWGSVLAPPLDFSQHSMFALEFQISEC